MSWKLTLQHRKLVQKAYEQRETIWTEDSRQSHGRQSLVARLVIAFTSRESPALDELPALGELPALLDQFLRH